jgi:hypothetical protein
MQQRGIKTQKGATAVSNKTYTTTMNNKMSEDRCFDCQLSSPIAWEPALQISGTLPGAVDRDVLAEICSVATDPSESSAAWCGSSVGSLISLDNSDDDCSVSSHLSCEDFQRTEDLDCIHNLEPVKIEPTLFKKHFSESQTRNNQAKIAATGGQATVISSSFSSSTIPLCFDDEDFDSIFEDVLLPLTPSSRAHNKKVIVKPRPLFETLPDDVICSSVLAFLDVESLSGMRSVSKRFNNLASRDTAGWDYHCRNLWSDKAHVCWHARQLHISHRSMEACWASHSDGKFRNEISPNELCFDPVSGQGTVWHFRFKETAGLAWTANDPWYAGMDARQMVFLRDGTVRRLLPGGGDQQRPYRLVPPFLSATEEDAMDPNPMQASAIEVKFRFILSPMDQHMRPRGADMRLNIRGRDVPTYIVRRSPTGNWGFTMENCWGIYASFPLPHRQEPNRGNTRMRLRRTSEGVGRWLNVEDLEESDSEDEDGSEGINNRHQHDRDKESLLTDAALPITNRHQWREALLYNYGAVALPEGEAATAEFDRIFQRFRSPRESLDMHNFLP